MGRFNDSPTAMDFFDDNSDLTRWCQCPTCYCPNELEEGDSEVCKDCQNDKHAGETIIPVSL